MTDRTESITVEGPDYAPGQATIDEIINDLRQAERRDIGNGALVDARLVSLSIRAIERLARDADDLRPLAPIANDLAAERRRICEALGIAETDDPVEAIEVLKGEAEDAASEQVALLAADLEAIANVVTEHDGEVTGGLAGQIAAAYKARDLAIKREQEATDVSIEEEERLRKRAEAAEAERDALRAEVEAKASQTVEALRQRDALWARAERAEAEVERLTRALAETDQRGRAFDLAATSGTLHRVRGCKCQWEEGDSPCPVHGEEETSADAGLLVPVDVALGGDPRPARAAHATLSTPDDAIREALGAGSRDLVEVATERMAAKAAAEAARDELQAALRKAEQRVTDLQATTSVVFERAEGAEAGLGRAEARVADLEDKAESLRTELATTVDAAGKAAASAQETIEGLRKELAGSVSTCQALRRRAAYYEDALAEALDGVAKDQAYRGAPEPFDEGYAWWLLHDANPYRVLYLSKLSEEAERFSEEARKECEDVPF